MIKESPTDNTSTKRCCKFITEGLIICRWPKVPRNPFPPLMPTVHDCVSQTGRGILSPLLKSYNAILNSQPWAPVSEFRRSLQSILSSKSSWTTTHRQGLVYGVNLNVLAERRAALHFKATRLKACAVDAASRIDASDVMKRWKLHDGS